MENRIFEEAHIGPLTLRNRTIRSAAFESMCPGHEPSQMLYDYHTSVARGGVGMTTVAYAAVTESGLSFDRQLVMKPEIIPDLRRLTDGIHKEGAAAGIQLGHCGNMSHKDICGCIPVGASNGFNLYSPTIVRGLRKDELAPLAKKFGAAVNLAREAGFDEVEIHCGHGYLIDQFLNPYFNHRHDEYGGSLENRMRFMTMCVEEAMKAAGEMSLEEFCAELDAIEKIRRLAPLQGKYNWPCPRCGCWTMDREPVRNALSRREKIYVCSRCGTEEAIEDFTRKFTPLASWDIARKEEWPLENEPM